MDGEGDPQQDPGLPTQSIWDIPFEDLQFKETIGKGSFGSVFKGSYLGVDVAIKKIEKADDPEYLKYIDREVSMLQSIRHPFIVQFSGICVHSSGLYIITEFVSGGDVRKLLKNNPALGWKKKIRVSIDLAKAMLFLHSKKIIHRDLKSKNILLDEHGRIRLCDFGFARMTETKRSKHMTMCGTEGWVAPEILLGMSYDTSCDIFSYGVVIAELITGKKPGVDLWVRTPDNCFDIHPDELRTKALPNCPPRLIDLCIDCCQYEPLLRPKFEDVLAALNVIDQNVPPDTPLSNRQDDTSSPNPTRAQIVANNRRSVINSNNNNTSSPVQTSPLKPAPSPSPNSPSASSWKMGAKSFKKSTNGPSTPNSPSMATVPQKLTSTSQTRASSQPAAVNMHLMKMVERATTDYYYDISYIHDLLLSYRCFTTPTNLFDLLVQRYHSSPPDGISAGELEAWHKSQKVIQLRVIIFLKRWIDSYHTDFQGKAMEDRLMSFDKSLPSNGLGGTSVVGDREDIQLIVLLQRKRNPRSATGTPSLPIYPQPWFPAGSTESLEVADVQPLEMARQISLIQSSLFVAIKPREYLQYCTERSGSHETCWVEGDPTEEVATNVHAFSKWSRSLSRLVASDIVKHADKARRAITLERFIEVADKCVTLKNFDAVFNIMEGITHPAIERLADTFKLLPSSAHKQLATLKQLVSKEGDLKQYREALAAATPPALPYFESVLDEMWFTECSSPKVLNGGIVNFFHYRQIARKAFTYQQCMPEPYQFRTVPPVQKLLIRSPDELLDDEQLKRKSLLREEPAYF